MKGPMNWGLSFLQERHKLDVLGGEPYLLFGLIRWSGGPLDISITLLMLNDSLNMVESWVPDPLTLLEPVMYWWYVGRFPGPWKQRSFETEFALKGGQTGAVLTQGDSWVLDPGNELAPGVLVVMAEGLEVVADFLDLLFGLPIRLWVVEDRLTVTHCLKKLPHLGN